jgi:O-antigen ligase
LVGALVGSLGLYLNPWVAIIAFPLAIASVIFTARPALLLPLVWFALLLSDGFRSPIQIGVPLTFGKAAAAALVLIWMVYVGLTRTPIVKLNRLSATMAAVIVLLTVGLAQTRALPGSSIEPYIGSTTLLVIVHVLWTVARPSELVGVLRLSALVFLLIVPAGVLFGGSIAETSGLRNTGFGGNPNVWAMTLIVGVGPAIASFAAESSRWLRWLGPVLAVATAVALAATVSRAGILAFVMLFPLLFIIMYRQRWLVMAALAVSVVAVPYLVDLDLIFERFSSFVDATELEMDGSVRDRALLQAYAIQAFQENPVFGMGTASFTSEVRYLSSGTQNTIAHNAYLQLLAEHGVVGGVVYATMYAVLGWMLWDAWRRAYSERLRLLVIGFVVSYIGYPIMNLADNGFEHAPSYYILGMAVALFYAAREPREVLEQIGFGPPVTAGRSSPDTSSQNEGSLPPAVPVDAIPSRA